MFIRDEKIKNGQRVAVRLLEEYKQDGIRIPANTHFIDCKILPKELIAEATKIQNKTSNGIIPKDLYGYGLHLEDKENGYLVYHGGLWNGYHNLWVYRPKDGVQIIYLSNFYNYSHPGQSRIWLKLIDEMMKG